MQKNGNLIQRFQAGDTAAAARMITMAESEDSSWGDYYDQIAKKVGRAFRTGFTGPPGAGKSTLVDASARALRDAKKKVGIVAVDPTSPFSGGALLGDRIRMQRVQLDEGVFIRSMATRGSLGGIAKATIDACDVIDAFGFDEVLIETVGVGQSETDILTAADTVTVVLCPGLGDGIQAMKAGLMEIADIFVINKADLPGAERLRNEISEALHLAKERGDWKPPILETVAANGKGVGEFWATVQRHREYLKSSGKLEVGRRDRKIRRVRRAVEERLKNLLWQEKGYGSAIEESFAGGKAPAPYSLVDSILDKVGAQLPQAQSSKHSSKRRSS